MAYRGFWGQYTYLDSGKFRQKEIDMLSTELGKRTATATLSLLSIASGVQ